jgi:hypothetical protein
MCLVERKEARGEARDSFMTRRGSIESSKQNGPTRQSELKFVTYEFSYISLSDSFQSISYSRTFLHSPHAQVSNFTCIFGYLHMGLKPTLLSQLTSMQALMRLRSTGTQASRRRLKLPEL